MMKSKGEKMIRDYCLEVRKARGKAARGEKFRDCSLEMREMVKIIYK